MPNELDDLERVLVDLNRASKHISGDNYEFYISLSVDDYLVDWANSKIDKQFFIDKFNSLKPLTDWASISTFQMRDEILGALSNKIYAHKECKSATHFIWLDTDMCFDEKILHYMEQSVNVIQTTTDFDKYLITPEIVKYWDTTWDCLVNEKYINYPLDYCKTNNPFIDCGEVGDIGIETVMNDVQGQPKTKFGAGWFTLLSKQLLDAIPLPESMGHYGPDDTFLMWGIEKLNTIGKGWIYQFKLKNYIVCENYIYRDRSHYDSLIKRIDRKEEFRQKANTAFAKEINELQ